MPQAIRTPISRFGPSVARTADGRLSRLVAALVLCVGLCSPVAGFAQERAVDLELVLAVDVSGSIDNEEAELQRQGYLSAIQHPEIVAAIRGGRLGRIAVTYVEWAGDLHQRTLVEWAEISDAESAAAFAGVLERQLIQTQLWTSISTVIDYAAWSFEGNGFQGRRRVIDISGDGPNNSGGHVVPARDRALAQEIVINGLTIINGRPGRYGYPPLPNLDLYYEDCVIGGAGAFVVVADGFGDFARAIQRKMLLEIAGEQPPAPLMRLAKDRLRPPCNAGERQLRRWRPDDYDY